MEAYNKRLSLILLHNIHDDLFTAFVLIQLLLVLLMTLRCLHSSIHCLCYLTSMDMYSFMCSSVRSIMSKHLMKVGEVTFDKIFNQKLGKLMESIFMSDLYMHCVLCAMVNKHFFSIRYKKCCYMLIVKQFSMYIVKCALYVKLLYLI